MEPGPSQALLCSPEFTRFLMGELAVCLRDRAIAPGQRAQVLLARIYHRTAALMHVCPKMRALSPNVTAVADYAHSAPSHMRLYAAVKIQAPGLPTGALTKSYQAGDYPAGFDSIQKHRLEALFRALKNLEDVEVWSCLQPLRFITDAPFGALDDLDRAMARDLGPLLARFQRHHLDLRLPAAQHRHAGPARRL